MIKSTLSKWKSLVLARFSKVQVAAIIILFVIAFLFGDSSLINRFSNVMEINDLQKQIEYYHGETVKSREKLMELNSSNDNIEKFARENYYMKKPDEDIFIVE
ncbi:MAG: septum formation initiator family protein [Dysgonamonadaceae bacterium]